MSYRMATTCILLGIAAGIMGAVLYWILMDLDSTP